MKKYRVALIDDHKLFRDGLSELIAAFQQFEVVLEADNGKDFIKKLNPSRIPDLVVLDINMKEMDGYETAAWIRQHHPQIKTLALSMYENETAVIRMIRAGADGYILKDVRKQELLIALNAIVEKRHYFSEAIAGNLVHLIRTLNDTEHQPGKSYEQFTEREIAFLKLICSDLTYKEIADRMHLSSHTIEGYREALFEKLAVKSRVGLVLYAIKNKIFLLE